ncbi:hypothetical protein [Natronococcus occultus]|uniref:Uncharacterized protein n=1 Tax=Natronococcus occultus SP4 TaxID=694430 RepID=L0JY11_9EURY|nr:hypothetical protein [Natronococcus occultus]AGB36743.1 hypothetical protein Natoc_0894 [Natronococcus occultus SP4]
MVDIGNPFGVDLATTIFGAGLSLVVSAGAMLYEEQITGWTSAEMIGATGVGLVVVGALLGIVLVIAGLR